MYNTYVIESVARHQVDERVAGPPRPAGAAAVVRRTAPGDRSGRRASPRPALRIVLGA